MSSFWVFDIAIGAATRAKFRPPMQWPRNPARTVVGKEANQMSLIPASRVVNNVLSLFSRIFADDQLKFGFGQDANPVKNQLPGWAENEGVG